MFDFQNASSSSEFIIEIRPRLFAWPILREFLITKCCYFVQEMFKEMFIVFYISKLLFKK